MSDVTMQELELETAELLPSRETLHCWRGPSTRCATGGECTAGREAARPSWAVSHPQSPVRM